MMKLLTRRKDRGSSSTPDAHSRHHHPPSLRIYAANQPLNNSECSSAAMAHRSNTTGWVQPPVTPVSDVFLAEAQATQASVSERPPSYEDCLDGAASSVPSTSSPLAPGPDHGPAADQHTTGHVLSTWDHTRGSYMDGVEFALGDSFRALVSPSAGASAHLGTQASDGDAGSGARGDVATWARYDFAMESRVLDEEFITARISSVSCASGDVAVTPSAGADATES